MKVIYIAGPYRDKRGPHFILQKIEVARQLAAELWALGNCAVICPHLNTYLLDGACEDANFLLGDLELIRRVDLVLVLPGWEESLGTKAEITFAEDVGKPILFTTGVLWREALKNLLS